VDYFSEDRHIGTTNTQQSDCSDYSAVASGQTKPRVDVSKLPFDPYEFIKVLPDWNNIEVDEEE
jgi:hypothetical protein